MSIHESSSKKSIPVSIRHSHPLVSLQHELNRAFSQFDRLFEPFNFPKMEFENLPLMPAMDVVDDEKHFKVELEIPGMDENDIKVAINNGVLTVKGEKTTSKQDKDKNYMSREIQYGMYERNIPLPEGIDVQNASASFKKGMLWVNIPKKSEFIKGSKEIPVQPIK